MSWFSKEKKGNSKVIDDTVVQVVTPVSTLAIVKESNYLPTVGVVDEHIRRLANYNPEAHRLVRELDDAIRLNKQLDVFRECGFRWFVSPDVIKKFKYHAGINKALRADKGTGIIYVGDIPDSVIHKLELYEKALGVGLLGEETTSVVDIKYYTWGKMHVTIHSNQSMPTRIVPHDPVIIGWVGIKFTYSSWTEMKDLKSPAVGVVIAVWDNDKEFEL